MTCLAGTMSALGASLPVCDTCTKEGRNVPVTWELASLPWSKAGSPPTRGRLTVHFLTVCVAEWWWDTIVCVPSDTCGPGVWVTACPVSHAVRATVYKLRVTCCVMPIGAPEDAAFLRVKIPTADLSISLIY